MERGGVTIKSVALVASAHPGPSAAVTSLTGLFALALGLDPARVLVLIAAVLSGQLSIGWSNDLIDLARDRAVGRGDKPLAQGRVDPGVVRSACVLALLLTVPLSFACGWRAGGVHLLCVSCGWAYNLGLKATPWSWLPYAIAFGGLPAFAWLTEHPGLRPPWWLVLVGALLGVGAHFLNALPDLDDDAVTGVRGLPHRLGDRGSRPVAIAILAAAACVVVARSTVSQPIAVAGLAATAALAGVALVARGRSPFIAAIGMAAVDVTMILMAL